MDVMEDLTEKDEIKSTLSGSGYFFRVTLKKFVVLKKNFNDSRKTILVDEFSNDSSISTSATDPISLVLTSKNTIKHITLKSLDTMFKNGTLKERTESFIQGVKCKMNDNFLLILNTGEYVKIEYQRIFFFISHNEHFPI